MKPACQQCTKAKKKKKPMSVSMTMERARLALKYIARPLSNSNIGSESLKIRNMCRLLSHYKTPTFIRALILHPHLSALLKAHTFLFLILLFLPVRGHNLLTYNNKHSHFHVDSSPPPRSWSQAQVYLSYQSYQFARTHLVSPEVPALSFIDILYS